MLQQRFQRYVQNYLQGYLLQTRQAIQLETVQQQGLLPSGSQVPEERSRGETRRGSEATLVNI